MDELLRCPHCGRDLHPDNRITYTFSWWATALVMIILSLMLAAFDIVDNQPGTALGERFTWSPWAIIGMWLLYISVQLVRYQPYYTWLMIPISGVLFSIFLAGLDRYVGPNDGVARMDWAMFAIIPIITFFVVMPIAARIARQQPTHFDRLDYLVDLLEENET